MTPLGHNTAAVSGSRARVVSKENRVQNKDRDRAEPNVRKDWLGCLRLQREADQASVGGGEGLTRSFSQSLVFARDRAVR